MTGRLLKHMSYDPSHHDTVVRAMASIFWGSAWADHVEEHRCCNLSGCKIEELMPEIPAEAYAYAERKLGAIEEMNPRWGKNWPSMFAAAMRADGKVGNYTGQTAERFGECLAWMAMGAGVSWFDSHQRFELNVPYCAEGDVALRALADERCKEEPGDEED